MATESLEERVKQLERRYRLMLSGIGLVVIACATIWVMTTTAGRAQAQPSTEAQQDVLAAREFTLVDLNGTVRAWLYMDIDADEPTLRLFDGQGNGCAWVSVSEAGPMLSLYGKNGTRRVALGVFEDGSGLRLWDKSGNQTWKAP